MPEIPKLCNLEIRMLCGTESKHFDKAIKQAAAINLLFMAFNQLSVKCNAICVERHLTYANCGGAI